MVKQLILSALLTLPVAALAGSKDEDALKKRLMDIQDGFNKNDAKALAALFAEDGDLINPIGKIARGRAEIEKLAAEDIANFVRGGKTTITLSHVKMVKPDVAIVDFTHEVTGSKSPDGKAMPAMKLMVTAVAVSAKNAWWFTAVRPMVPFTPPAGPATASKTP